MKLTSVALLSVLASACSMAPIATDDAREVPASQVLIATASQPGMTAKVIVKRDLAFYGTACQNHVIVDGKPYAKLWAGERVTLHLPAGSLLLGVQMTGALCTSEARELRVELKADQLRTFVMSFPPMQSLTFNETAL